MDKIAYPNQTFLHINKCNELKKRYFFSFGIPLNYITSWRKNFSDLSSRITSEIFCGDALKITLKIITAISSESITLHFSRTFQEIHLRIPEMGYLVLPGILKDSFNISFYFIFCFFFLILPEIYWHISSTILLLHVCGNCGRIF